jgi:hypothetical protein
VDISPRKQTGSQQSLESILDPFVNIKKEEPVPIPIIEIGNLSKGEINEVFKFLK